MNYETPAEQRVWYYTRPSKLENFKLILQSTTNLFRAFVPWPYDYMSATRSFELDRTAGEHSLWMVWDRDSMSKLANMEY